LPSHPLQNPVAAVPRSLGLDGAAVGQFVTGEGENFVKVLALGIKPVCGTRMADMDSWMKASAAVCLLSLKIIK
jgi:hypothetical protein